MVDADFDGVVASLDAPMAIVTTSVDDERAGCLVGFHSQCSIEPRRYVVWLSKANHTYRAALQSEALVVHMLSGGDLDLAETFGTLSGDDVDKSDLVDWEQGPLGLPVLTRCPNRFAGRRVALLDEGSDHVCVVIDIVDASRGGPFVPLRLADVARLVPGHEAKERPQPPTQRA